MTRLRYLFTVFFLLVFSFHINAKSYRPMAKIVAPKAVEVEARGTYFSTTSYFDYEGNKQNMDSGASFTKIDGLFLGRYGYSSRLEFRAGMNYRQNSSQSVNHDVDKSGVESYLAGITWQLPRVGLWDYALDFQYRQTAYTNTIYDPGTAPDGTVVLGDDGSEVTFKAKASRTFSKDHVISGMLGYNIPPSSLSQELLYGLEIAWPFERLALFAGVEGVHSMKGDDYASDPASKPQIDSDSSAMFNSINRQYLKPYGGLNLAFGSFKIGAQMGQIMQGVSTDEGIEYQAHITWTSKTRNADLSKINLFKEYIVEASVIKVSPRQTFLKIDKGIANDVEKGMKIDIYKSDYFGNNDLVATGLVYELGAEWAIVKLVKRYRSDTIKMGFAARGY